MLSARKHRGNPARLIETVVTFQLASIAATSQWTEAMLEEQDIPATAEGALVPAMLAGVASDGRDLGSLLTIPDLSEDQFDRIVATQLQDVSRQAASIERATRPQVTSYVRAVNLPACGRCIILAGRVYGSDVAFQRHPRCDCIMVPSTSRLAGRLSTDPAEAISRMSEEEREKALTKAGARAVELGADPARVVNARRGMSTAQGSMELSGHTQVRKPSRLNRERDGEVVAKTAYYARGRLIRDADGLYTTTENATTRAARRRLRDAGVTGRRLMPESIIERAGSDADAIRMLHQYGYIR